MEQAQVAGPYETAEEQVERLWWIPLVSGSLWIIFSLIVFQFDYTTVKTLSILVGTVCIAAALFQLTAAFGTHGWWRVASVQPGEVRS